MSICSELVLPEPDEDFLQTALAQVVPDWKGAGLVSSPLACLLARLLARLRAVWMLWLCAAPSSGNDSDAAAWQADLEELTTATQVVFIQMAAAADKMVELAATDPGQLAALFQAPNRTH